VRSRSASDSAQSRVSQTKRLKLYVAIRADARVAPSFPVARPHLCRSRRTSRSRSPSAQILNRNPAAPRGVAFRDSQSFCVVGRVAVAERLVTISTRRSDTSCARDISLSRKSWERSHTGRFVWRFASPVSPSCRSASRTELSGLKRVPAVGGCRRTAIGVCGEPAKAVQIGALFGANGAPRAALGYGCSLIRNISCNCFISCRRVKATNVS
jgi:hypothetical protein